LEKIIYETENVVITNKVIEVDKKIYTLKSINGVSYSTEFRHKMYHFIFGVISIFLLIQTNFFDSGKEISGGYAFAFFSLLVFWNVIFTDQYVHKFTYVVCIEDFGKNKRIYTTTSEDEAKNIVKKIEKVLRNQVV
jgi:hypothetical protein